MKITFLGSSHGVPEPHRNTSSALLEVGEKKYLIDIGPNPVPELVNRGIAVEDITACFVTHMHGDHVNGILPFVDLMSWYFKTADPAFYLPKAGVVEGIRSFFSYTGTTLREDLRFYQIEEGCFYRDEEISVTAFRTGHCDVSYSFVIEAEGKRVLFSGDLKHKDGPVADFDRIIGNDSFDLVICECAHFDAELYREPLLRNTPKRFIFNHYSLPKTAGCLDFRKEMADTLDIRLATDGLTVEL